MSPTQFVISCSITSSLIVLSWIHSIIRLSRLEAGQAAASQRRDDMTLRDDMVHGCHGCLSFIQDDMVSIRKLITQPMPER